MCSRPASTDSSMPGTLICGCDHGLFTPIASAPQATGTENRHDLVADRHRRTSQRHRLSCMLERQRLESRRSGQRLLPRPPTPSRRLTTHPNRPFQPKKQKARPDGADWQPHRTPWHLIVASGAPPPECMTSPGRLLEVSTHLRSGDPCSYAGSLSWWPVARPELRLVLARPLLAQ